MLCAPMVGSVTKSNSSRSVAVATPVVCSLARQSAACRAPPRPVGKARAFAAEEVVDVAQVFLEKIEAARVVQVHGLRAGGQDG